MNFFKLITLGLLSVTLIHCSSKPKSQQPSAPPVAAAEPAMVAPSEATPSLGPAQENASSKELDELKISLKKAEAIVKKDDPVHQSDYHHRKPGAVSSEKALGWLKNGNTRFTKAKFRKDGASQKDVAKLASGQKPHTVVLSCSDSRVPPEVIFDQKLGEIFVVRTAGSSLDESVIASIEYAVEHLGPNFILVMGHTNCGAVKAAIETAAGADTGSPYINALVAEIQPRLSGRAQGPASENLVVEGWDNVRGVSQKLLEKSKLIREASKSGSLRVETALYNLKSGQVEWTR